MNCAPLDATHARKFTCVVREHIRNTLGTQTRYWMNCAPLDATYARKFTCVVREHIRNTLGTQESVPGLAQGCRRG
jgi:hypothetical protein